MEMSGTLARIRKSSKTFHYCLKSEEFTALEPAVLENKFYCPGVGIVRERDVKGGTVSTALTNVLR